MLIFNMMHAWVRKWHSNSKAGLQAGLDYGVTILFGAEFLKSAAVLAMIENFSDKKLMSYCDKITAENE